MQWPTGTGAKGNAGVAGAVQQTAGAVGYVEQAYALEHNFTYAIGEEQGRQLRRARRSPRPAPPPKASRCRRTWASKSSTRRRRPPTRSPRRRSSSSTRTSARPASPAAKRPPRASSKFLDYGLGAGPGDPLARPTTRRCPPRSSPSPRRRSRALQCNGTPLGRLMTRRPRSPVARRGGSIAPERRALDPRALAARAPARPRAEVRA